MIAAQGTYSEPGRRGRKRWRRPDCLLPDDEGEDRQQLVEHRRHAAPGAPSCDAVSEWTPQGTGVAPYSPPSDRPRCRRFRAPGSTGYGSQYSVVRWLRLIGCLDRGQRVLYLPGIAVNRAAVACQGVPDATQGVY